MIHLSPPDHDSALFRVNVGNGRKGARSAYERIQPKHAVLRRTAMSQHAAR